MTKREFLDKLKSALGNDMNSSAVQENIAYYNEYIDNEVRMGRSEAEVVAELGDPWAIAKTISGSAQSQSGAQGSSVYEPDETTDDRKTGKKTKMHVINLNSKWKAGLILLGILGIIFLLLAVIGGIISFLAPMLLPLIVIITVIRLFKNRR